MPSLSASEIAGVIKFYDVGGPQPIAPITDDNAVIAIAIALAESGGNPDAVGGPNSNGTYDYGLWQINSIHNPVEREKHSAAANWLLAWRIAGMGTSWKPWATYNSGAYKTHMAAAQAAWKGATPGTIGGNASGSVENAPTYWQFDKDNPLAFLNPIFEPGAWARIGMIVAGGLLLLLVAAALMKNTVIKASPIGKIAKAVEGA